MKSTKSGSYFRVLETGTIAAGDAIKQVEQPFPNWPLDKVFRLIIGGDHKGKKDELEYLSRVSVLAESWRNRAKQLLAANYQF